MRIGSAGPTSLRRSPLFADLTMGFFLASVIVGGMSTFFVRW